jgi:antirestriction protein ArdC
VGYYATLFHELIHSTGHPCRLNRPTLTESAGFGSDPYCREELVAELGAAFLCGHTGIENTIQNSAAYLQNWLEALKNDRTLIVQAAAQAQKAATTFSERSLRMHQRAENEAPVNFSPAARRERRAS